MKKLLVAATMLMPLVIAAPAFARGMDTTTRHAQTHSVASYAKSQPREFSAHRAGNGYPGGETPLDHSLIQREAVPSSAFGSSS